MRQLLAPIATVTSLVVVLVVLVAGTPAHAASAAPPPTRDPSPALPGYAWGAPWDSIPVCAPSTSVPDRGGWSGRRVISFGSGNGVDNSYASPVQATVFTLDEPCRLTSGQTGNNRVRVGYEAQTLPSPAQPYVPGGSMHTRDTWTYGSSTLQAQLVCASASWSTAAQRTTYLRPTASGAVGNFPGIDSTASVDRRTSDPEGSFVGAGWQGSSCPFLVSIRYNVCHYPAPSSALQCDSFVWAANEWFLNRSYDSTPADVLLCRNGAVSSECAYLDPPEDLTWDTVCGVGAPSWSLPTPGDPLAWVEYFFTDLFPYIAQFVSELISHYGRCMFVPPAGFDRHGTIPAAWGSSGFVNATAVIGDAVSAFTMTETCGTILDASGSQYLPELTLDTCTWASWASPVKTFITWSGWLLFSWWAVQFVLQILMALFKAAPYPSPFVTDAASTAADDATLSRIR